MHSLARRAGMNRRLRSWARRVGNLCAKKSTLFGKKNEIPVLLVSKFRKSRLDYS